MTWADFGSGLQVAGGAIEAGALVWAARRLDERLRRHGYEDATDGLETTVKTTAAAASPERVLLGIVARYLGDRIDRLHEALRDATATPLRLFLAGIGANVLGVALAAGWF